MFFQDCLVLMNTCLFYLKKNKGLRPFVVMVVVQNAFVPGEIALTFFINMESTYLLGIEIYFVSFTKFTHLQGQSIFRLEYCITCEYLSQIKQAISSSETRCNFLSSVLFCSSGTSGYNFVLTQIQFC